MIALRPRSSHRRCAFCFEQLQAEVEVRECARCKTVLHRACREELQGCPTLCCTPRSESPETRRAEPLERPEPLAGRWRGFTPERSARPELGAAVPERTPALQEPDSLPGWWAWCVGAASTAGFVAGIRLIVVRPALADPETVVPAALAMIVGAGLGTLALLCLGRALLRRL